VLVVKAAKPIPILQSPTVLNRKALAPTAVLKIPVVLAAKLL
jgi:hypothetical protein